MDGVQPDFRLERLERPQENTVVAVQAVTMEAADDDDADDVDDVPVAVEAFAVGAVGVDHPILETFARLAIVARTRNAVAFVADVRCCGVVMLCPPSTATKR